MSFSSIISRRAVSTLNQIRAPTGPQLRFICQSLQRKSDEISSNLTSVQPEEEHENVPQVAYDWYLPTNADTRPSTSEKKVVVLENLPPTLPADLVSLSNYIANEIPALDPATIEWTERHEGLWKWCLSVCVIRGRGRNGLRVACSDLQDWCAANIKTSKASIHHLPSSRDKDPTTSYQDLDWALLDCSNSFIGHVFGSVNSRQEQFALPNSERWRSECDADWQTDNRWQKWMEDTKKYSTAHARKGKKGKK